jgi:hypothetical protein
MNDLPRGLRNNNPLNIRLGARLWPGEIVGGDPAFRTFATMVDGICEGARLLVQYGPKLEADGKTVCVANIVARWAPAVENDVSAYAIDVAQRLAVSLTQPIDLHNPIILRQLVLAMSRHENGAAADRALTPDLLAAGVTAALARP